MIIKAACGQPFETFISVCISGVRSLAPRAGIFHTAGKRAVQKKAGVALATLDEAGNLSVYRKEKSPSARNRLQ